MSNKKQEKTPSQTMRNQWNTPEKRIVFKELPYQKWNTQLYKQTMEERMRILRYGLELFGVFFSLYWPIIIIISYLSHVPFNALSAGVNVLLSIDIAFLNLTNLLFSGSPQSYTALLLSLSIVIIYARLRFGEVYYRSAFKVFSLIIPSISVSIFMIYFIPLLAFLGSNFIYMLVILVIGILFYVVFYVALMFVFGLIGFFFSLVIKGERHPIAPREYVVPYLLQVHRLQVHQTNYTPNPENYCPYRMKNEPGCAFLGVKTAPGKKIICDYPETWNDCYIYHHVKERQEKKGGY